VPGDGRCRRFRGGFGYGQIRRSATMATHISAK
jgi:hypothetical protein